MSNPDRYTVRNVVNTLVDRLINEGVDRKDILEELDELELSESDIEYFDISWLRNEI